MNDTNAKLTRKQRRHFDRAFERIRGKLDLFRFFIKYKFLF